MKKHLSTLLAAAALALCAAPAHAQTAEGWLFHKAGDFTISPIHLGPAANLGDDFGGGRTGFTLFTDFDYHLTPEMAVGALVNIGFGSGLVAFDFGPQFKYKFKIGSTGHVPFLRAAIPLRMGVFSSDAFGVGSQTLVGIGLQVGGGYRYWFHRRVAVGADLSLVPTFIVSSPGPGTFYFGINFQAGIELKL